MRTSKEKLAFSTISNVLQLGRVIDKEREREREIDSTMLNLLKFYKATISLPFLFSSRSSWSRAIR